MEQMQELIKNLSRSDSAVWASDVWHRNASARIDGASYFWGGEIVHRPNNKLNRYYIARTIWQDKLSILLGAAIRGLFTGSKQTSSAGRVSISLHGSAYHSLLGDFQQTGRLAAGESASRCGQTGGGKSRERWWPLESDSECLYFIEPANQPSILDL